MDTALAWTGPLPSRPEDVLAVGVAHVATSQDFARSLEVASPAAPKADYERAWELTYILVLSDYLSVQGDLQWINHPGGSAAQEDALVGMIRVTATY